MTNAWSPADVLPDELDVTAAVVYQEVEGVVPALGGKWLVWPERVWWQRPDGRFQQSVFTAGAFSGPRWVRVEA